MTWREKARPIIARVIRDVGTDDPKALRKALLAAYPFGARKYFPYKVWCDEINYQLGRGRHAAKVKGVDATYHGPKLF